MASATLLANALNSSTYSPREWHDDMQTFAPRGPQEGLQPGRLQSLSDFLRTAHDVFPGDSFAGVKIEYKLVWPLQVIFSRGPRMQF